MAIDNLLYIGSRNITGDVYRYVSTRTASFKHLVLQFLQHNIRHRCTLQYHYQPRWVQHQTCIHRGIRPRSLSLSFSQSYYNVTRRKCVGLPAQLCGGVGKTSYTIRVQRAKFRLSGIAMFRDDRPSSGTRQRIYDSMCILSSGLIDNLPDINASYAFCSRVMYSSCIVFIVVVAPNDELAYVFLHRKSPVKSKLGSSVTPLIFTAWWQHYSSKWVHTLQLVCASSAIFAVLYGLVDYLAVPHI